MKPKKRSATSDRAAAVVKRFAKQSRTLSDKELALSLGGLRRALNQTAADLKPSSLSHAEMEDILPHYVAEEKLGVEVRDIYPRAWAHLRKCKQCRALRDILADKGAPPGLKAGAPGEQEKSLPPALESQAWVRSVKDKRYRFFFRFAPRFIFAAWSPPASGFVARGTGAENKQLLIADSVPLAEGRHLFFQAWLEPENQSAQYRQLRLCLMPFTPVLDAKLFWNGRGRRPRRVHDDLLFERVERPREDRAQTGQSNGEFALKLRVGGKIPKH